MFKKLTKEIIIHTPNYAIVSSKCVFDSSKDKGKIMEIVQQYEEIGEDPSVKVYLISKHSKVTIKDILKVENGCHEIATKKQIEWQDRGVMAMRVIGFYDKVDKTSLEEADKWLLKKHDRSKK